MIGENQIYSTEERSLPGEPKYVVELNVPRLSASKLNKPTWRPHWTVAPILLPLIPFIPRKLSGPIGSAPLGVAFVAHFVAILLAIHCFSALYLADSTGDLWLVLSEAPKATFVNYMNLTNSVGELMELFIVLSLFELILLLLAIIRLPWMIRGESYWHGFLTSLKVAWWSSATYIAFPVSWLIYMTISPQFFPYFPKPELFLATLISLTLVWVLRILNSLSLNCSGPANGKLYKPFSIQCVRCGYELTMLERRGHCPECNEPVTNSLPEARTLPAHAKANSFIERMAMYPKTWRDSLRGKSFGKRLRVYASLESAQRFAITTSDIIGIVAAATALTIGDTIIDYEVMNEEPWAQQIIAQLLIIYGIVSSGSLLLIWLAGATLSTFGTREPERITTVVAYSSSWLILISLSGAIAVIWSWLCFDVLSISGGLFLPIVNLYIDTGTACAMLGALPCIICFGLWIGNHSKMLQATRYASA